MRLHISALRPRRAGGHLRGRHARSAQQDHVSSCGAPVAADRDTRGAVHALVMGWRSGQLPRRPRSRASRHDRGAQDSSRI